MRMHDVAEGESVGTADRHADCVARALVRRPCRIAIELSRRQRRFRRRDTARAIEKAIHVDRPDDG